MLGCYSRNGFAATDQASVNITIRYQLLCRETGVVRSVTVERLTMPATNCMTGTHAHTQPVWGPVVELPSWELVDLGYRPEVNTAAVKSSQVVGLRDHAAIIRT